MHICLKRSEIPAPFITPHSLSNESARTVRKRRTGLEHRTWQSSRREDFMCTHDGRLIFLIEADVRLVRLAASETL